MANFWGPLSELYSTLALDLFKNLLIAVVTLLIGFVIGKILGKLAERILKEIEIDKSLKKLGIRISIAELIGLLISYFLYAVAIVSALNQLKVTEAILSVIQAALVIVLVVSLILGIKDFIPNFFAGLFMASNGLISKGDYIKIRNAEGRVVKRGLVETIIENYKGEILYVPNAILVKQEIVKIKRKK